MASSLNDMEDWLRNTIASAKWNLDPSMRWYGLDGKDLIEIDKAEWDRKVGDVQITTVGDCTIGAGRVWTVFTGLSSMIFATALFHANGDAEIITLGASLKRF